MAKIEVSTSQVSEPAPKPVVSSYFDYEVPETVEGFQKKYPPQLVNGKLVDPVYDLLVNQFTIAVQAPARKELVVQWESLDFDARQALITQPKVEGGQPSATLPDEQQARLQARMDSWTLGEKSPRVRTVVVAGDPVENFLKALPGMTEERKAEIQAQVAQLLGLQAQRPRK